jgi:uncharacterized MAPEG superfamily protein
MPFLKNLSQSALPESSVGEASGVWSSNACAVVLIFVYLLYVTQYFFPQPVRSYVWFRSFYSSDIMLCCPAVRRVVMYMACSL